MNRFLLLFLSSIFFSCQVWAIQPIDLTKNDIFVRTGFNPSWLKQIPQENQTWKRVEGVKKGGRSVQIRKLNLDGVPSRIPFSLYTSPVQHFTMLTHFSLTEKDLQNYGSLGLYLGTIGVNWEIYINGKQIRSEVYLDDEGEIDLYKNQRNAIIEIDPRTLKQGENILAFHILGDPNHPETGFYTGKPFLIQDYQKLIKRMSDPLILVLIFFYFIAGLAFIWIYVQRPKDRFYLQFGLFGVFFSCYKFTITTEIQELIPNLAITTRLEHIFLYTLFPAFLYFSDTFLWKRTRTFTKIYTLLSALFLFFCFWAPFAFMADLLRVFQITAIIPWFYLLGFSFLPNLRKRYFRRKQKKAMSKKWLSVLFVSNTGQLFLGTMICFILMIIDIINSLFFLSEKQITQYGFFVLSAQMGLALLYKFNKTQDNLLDSHKRALKNKDLAIKNLRKADELKDDFLANTSHELRTPLHGIIGIAESTLDLLPSTLPSNEIAKNLSIITTSGRRLSMLINDVLDLSKLRNNEISLEFKSLDLYQVVEVVLALSKPLTVGKKITLKNHISPDLKVKADENRLQQILHNLVGNALKFTERGNIELSAGIKEQKVVITVADTGIGIPEESFKSIFQSFEQNDDSLSKQYMGTGLGLSISKWLVQLHGGEIWLESKLGFGSTFFFSFPLSEEPAQNLTQNLPLNQFQDNFVNNPLTLSRKLKETRAEIQGSLDQNQLDLQRELNQKELQRELNQKELQGELNQKELQRELNQKELDQKKQEKQVKLEQEQFTQEQLERGRGQSFRVLVVDDDPINQQVVKNYLSGKEFHLIQVLHGEEALKVLEQGPEKPDLILLDIMMPQISGFDVCKFIRKKYDFHSLPILFLSAKNQVSDLIEAFSLGANDYLSKPFSKNELLTRVRFHLDFHDQIEVNRRRMESLGQLSQNLEKFKNNAQLIQAIFIHCQDNLNPSSAVIYQDGKLMGSSIEGQVSISSDATLDPFFQNFSIPSIEKEESALILHPWEMGEQGSLLLIRPRYLDEYVIVLYRDAASSLFNPADLEYAKSLVQDVKSVRENLQTFIGDEESMKKYLELKERLDEIYVIKGDRQFCKILYRGEKKVVDFDWSLGEIETYFSEKSLLRVHKSFIINPNKGFTAYRKKGSRDYEILFENPKISEAIESSTALKNIRIARSKEQQFKENYPHWFQ